MVAVEKATRKDIVVRITQEEEWQMRIIRRPFGTITITIATMIGALDNILGVDSVEIIKKSREDMFMGEKRMMDR